MASPVRIVIVGGGFGGVYAAKTLAPYVRRGEAVVTLISRDNHFLFTPLLHEVATGSLSPESVAEPLREVFRGTGIVLVQATCERVDYTRKTVVTDRGEYPYEYLMLATGASAVPPPSGAEDGSVHTLKTLADAVAIRRNVIGRFEEAATADPARRTELLSFAVVGTGPTGVELAAELAEFACGTLAPYYRTAGLRCDDVRITLVGSGPDVLPMFSVPLRKYAAAALMKKGVTLALGKRVTGLAAGAVVLEGGERIPAGTVLWAVGVRPTLPGGVAGHAERGNRIAVNEFLQVADAPEVFVVGDAAGRLDPASTEQRTYPMLAQVAVREGACAAENIMRHSRGHALLPFSFTLQGSLVSLGRWNAIAEIFGYSLHGRFAWWLWRTVYLSKFASWRKRFKVAAQWTVNLFSPRDITRLS